MHMLQAPMKVTSSLISTSRSAGEQMVPDTRSDEGIVTSVACALTRQSPALNDISC